MKNTRVTREQAKRLGKLFRIDFTVVPFDEWVTGLRIELEHGTTGPGNQLTNVTNDSQVDTARIAVAHLIEDPRYYKYLKEMETAREKYWNSRHKPTIFK